ncbi:uncharacterized protein LOC116028055 [Ipomoea triloba]|uniref:uncharacterized protein LOC116028055 n=1 Tax=Ipomoea triloba TaxID=35885 RepID=UPI00125D5489|nr:uncharacterized protein LOC116028055 [Ipomoea triloba]
MDGGRDPFFGFGNPFGGFGAHRSLMSSFFGGRDPFDDPFFTQPFGGLFESSFVGPNIGPNLPGFPNSGIFGPNGSQFMGPRLAGFPGSGVFGPNGSQFIDSRPTGFLEQQQLPQRTASRGPIIEELDSDDETEEKEEKERTSKEGNPRKHGRLSGEPFVEDPDDETEERRRKQIHYGNEFGQRQMQHFQPQPQGQSFTFQSSTVTYGGANGAYYTSSRTRRTGSDGLAFEESKEANSATGQARHKISRGIHDKGHSVMRKLNPDGRVDTMQTLHNLNEDELPSFEEDWKGKAKMHLPSWSQGLNANGAIGDGSNAQNGVASRGGWALPSTERVPQSSSTRPIYGDGTFRNEQPSVNQNQNQNQSFSSTATRKDDKRGGRRFH